MRILSAILAALAAACAPQDPTCAIVDHDELPAASAPLGATVVTDGLEVPWALAFTPAGDVVVTERGGRLRFIDVDATGESGALADTPLATLAVTDGGEGGLLGVAVAPDFADSGALFTYRTVADGSENVIERLVVDDPVAPTSASVEQALLEGVPANRNHDGGRLHVGPDGNLWASTGDAQDPQLSRSRASLAGKLLRMTLEGAPVDGAADLIALTGIRNAQGFAFLEGHAAESAGDVVVTDHGPSGEFARLGHDEVNVASLDGGGDDLGWPDAHACDAVDGVRSPLRVFGDALPPGGVALLDVDGRTKAFVAALGARKLIELDVLTGEAEVHLDGTHGRLRDVVAAPDGALWVTTSNCDGRGDCPDGGDAILRLTR